MAHASERWSANAFGLILFVTHGIVMEPCININDTLRKPAQHALNCDQSRPSASWTPPPSQRPKQAVSAAIGTVGIITPQIRISDRPLRRMLLEYSAD
jgi:hypothetical protein